MAKGLLESAVAAQVVSFMEAEGFVAKRNQVARVRVPTKSGKDRFFSVGNKGYADWTFTKYLRSKYPGLSVTCHIETKREKGGIVRQAQADWRRDEEAKGAVVMKADSFDTFRADYYRIFGWLKKFTSEVA